MLALLLLTRPVAARSAGTLCSATAARCEKIHEVSFEGRPRPIFLSPETSDLRFLEELNKFMECSSERHCVELFVPYRDGRAQGSSAPRCYRFTFRKKIAAHLAKSMFFSEKNQESIKSDVFQNAGSTVYLTKVL